VPCPAHGRPRGARWSRDRDGAAQNRFARALRRRSGGLCERCHQRQAQVAHHVRPGYEPADGLDLCDDCHRTLDPHARRT
jgi:hypothetical protein